MNSGIQFRSLSIPAYQDGRVHGYQINLDTNEISDIGGLRQQEAAAMGLPPNLLPKMKLDGERVVYDANTRSDSEEAVSCQTSNQWIQ